MSPEKVSKRKLLQGRTRIEHRTGSPNLNFEPLPPCQESSPKKSPKLGKIKKGRNRRRKIWRGHCRSPDCNHSSLQSEEVLYIQTVRERKLQKPKDDCVPGRGRGSFRRTLTLAKISTVSTTMKKHEGEGQENLI